MGLLFLSELKFQGKFVFFDLECDTLFRDYESWNEALSKMKMTVGVLFDGTTFHTFFGNNSEHIEKLGKMMDSGLYFRIVVTSLTIPNFLSFCHCYLQPQSRHRC